MSALRESLVHSGPFSGKLVRIGGLADALGAEITQATSLGVALSVTSRVWDRRGALLGHLALMNLHPDGFGNLAEVTEAVGAVVGGLPGYILDSGRYLHYYGCRLLPGDEWLDFVSQFLMPCTLVSPRYVGHCVVRRFCALRLNAVPPHKPAIPRLVRTVGMADRAPAPCGPAGPGRTNGRLSSPG